MARNSLLCADVPLRNYSLHSFRLLRPFLAFGTADGGSGSSSGRKTKPSAICISV